MSKSRGPEVDEEESQPGRKVIGINKNKALSKHIFLADCKIIWFFFILIRLRSVDYQNV